MFSSVVTKHSNWNLFSLPLLFMLIKSCLSLSHKICFFFPQKNNINDANKLNITITDFKFTKMYSAQSFSEM